MAHAVIIEAVLWGKAWFSITSRPTSVSPRGPRGPQQATPAQEGENQSLHDFTSLKPLGLGVIECRSGRGRCWPLEHRSTERERWENCMCLVVFVGFAVVRIKRNSRYSLLENVEEQAHQVGPGTSFMLCPLSKQRCRCLGPVLPMARSDNGT